MIKTDNEQHLVEACRRGERYAQKELYERYCNYMMLICCRYIKEKEDAREVLSDGFLNFFKNISRFAYQGDGSVRAWLSRIMVNQCLMHLRKRPGPQIIDIDLAEADVVIDETTLARMSMTDIIKLIQQLPAGYRTVFNLYFFEDKKLNEIADVLSVSENTVKSQLRKAKQMLQKKITQAINA